MKDGWQTKTLSEACQIKPPKSEARDKLSAGSLVSFLPMEDMGVDNKFVNATQTKSLSAVVGSYTYFADGDVLLAKITPCFENGKLGIAKGLKNGIGFGSSEYFVFRPDKALSEEWLYYFLSHETFRIEGAARMSGAVGHKRVAKEFIENYPIPVPPLPEQRRIVGILDEAFAGIAIAKANAEKNLQNARALFESHLQSVFTQRGSSSPPVRLGNMVKRLTNGYVGPTRGIYGASGIPYLLARHVKSNILAFDGKTFVSEAFNAKNRKSILKAGDVLLVQSGHIGHSAVVTPRHEGHNCHAMIVITPSEGQLYGQYLSWFFGSPLMQRRFERMRTGSTIKHLNCGDVIELQVPTPSLADQKRIVEEINRTHLETQRLESIYQRKLAALDALKKSLLHQAFTGEL